MTLSTDRQMRQLPKRLPVGTVYVVEGRRGQRGNLRVSSRYVVMPTGQKVDIPAELGPKQAISGGSRLLFGSYGRPVSRAKRFSPPAKKFVRAAGTRQQEQR